MNPPNIPQFQCSIQDPSGHKRVLKLDSSKTEFIIGQNLDSEILLRDPTLPEQIARLKISMENNTWTLNYSELIETKDKQTLRINGLKFKSGQLPLQVPVEIGETKISFAFNSSKTRALPELPKGVKPWLTNSASGESLLWDIKKTANTSLSTYIAGETGTGKELIAGMIHAWSDRKDGPYIPLNCAALTPSLAESELFGHLRGAYTGASNNRVGALMQAHGGTLFLDEVGDLSPELQVKLLRFLENGEVRAVGSDQTKFSDVRIVCATHLPLRKLVEEGKFRRDLYYRIASVHLEVPSLRSRPEDITLIAQTLCAEKNKYLSSSAIHTLHSYSWPGNVRELKHCIERACAQSESVEHTLSEKHFDFLQKELGSQEKPTLSTEQTLQVPFLSMHEMERHMLLNALKVTSGNRVQSAQLLGVARSTLFEMLKRHQIKGPRQERIQTKKLLDQICANRKKNIENTYEITK